MIKLLFFSFWLILATTHPSAQDRVSTKTDSSTSSSRPPSTVLADISTTTQYTMSAGRYTTAEYIRPMRYTLMSRAAMMTRTGMGSDSSRSLSLAM